MSRRRRADGKLRPCRVRYARKKRGGPFVDPTDEEKFRGLVLGGTIIWAGRQLLEQCGTTEAALAFVLEDLAGRAHWAKLRDTSGAVRAIAMPRNHPRRRDGNLGEHRELMRRLVVEVAVRREQA